ncbi:MAG: cyclic nucleotide-binding domain-containing protein [Candidatus Latescibacteria bacterium]|nr:cyclic nucleotide-binding domain-containing protein [Candidatus Latescibacterota bacterium]
MILVQKILFLKNVPLFSSMPPNELGYLGHIAEEHIFDTGHKIITQGEHGESLYLIVEGKVSITQNGKQVAELSETDFFGEMSILDGEPRSASVETLTNCFILCISKEDFYGILSRYSEVALHVIRTLTQRLRQSSTHPPPPQ